MQVDGQLRDKCATGGFVADRSVAGRPVNWPIEDIDGAGGLVAGRPMDRLVGICVVRVGLLWVGLLRVSVWTGLLGMWIVRVGMQRVSLQIGLLRVRDRH